jgi:hypothetical protein
MTVGVGFDRMMRAYMGQEKTGLEAWEVMMVAPLAIREEFAEIREHVRARLL